MARVMGYAAVPNPDGADPWPGHRRSAILQHASWRWLFLVNLPVGVLAIVLAVLFLPNDREETRSEETRSSWFSPSLSPGLVLFLYGSDHLGKRIGLPTLLISIVLLARPSSRWPFEKGTRRSSIFSYSKRKTFSCVRHHAGSSCRTEFLVTG